MMTRWHDIQNILGAMDLFRTQMNSLFTDFDRAYSSGRGWGGPDVYPRTNLNDTGDNLELIAEIPGVGREELNVKIQGNYLEISGSRTTDAPEGYTVHRTERPATTFSRSFTLPYEVDAAKVTATLKDGLLTMTLPKSEAAKPRQISIQ
ncbi:Hsp20/alpha crystallin family protein [Desulfobulbus elongatus]|uniref:Hsp20/alpha crystallin family protein n=1 Tax=Desulfobulbus elongatus TaxID=53332 RepID=UPI000489FEFB|nr:Hsp20/alpha crystallin family protein [Desulfobulbus elongatus]